MTGASGPGRTGPSGETTRQMRAIGAGLTDAGLDMFLTRRVVCWTSPRRWTGRVPRPARWSSEDGYVELRFWNQPGATPEQITTVIVRALAAIAAAQRA